MKPGCGTMPKFGRSSICQLHSSEGISRQPGPELDLGPDLPGYKLRATTVTFAPGAVRALHDHRKNPEITYTLQGKLTEFSKAGALLEFGPGAFRANGRDVEHWWRTAARRNWCSSMSRW